jgi:integrase/recombinase XerD
MKAIYDEFLLAKSLEGCSENTIDAYKYSIERLLKAYPNPTASDIRNWLVSLNVSDVTRATYIKNLRTFYNWSFREGLIDSNPMTNIKTPKVNLVNFFVLDETDIKKLINAVKRSPRNLAMILFMLDTGVRVGEMCKLELEDLNIPNGSALIRYTKTGTVRMVYFSPTTARALTRYLNVRKDSIDNAVFLSYQSRLRMNSYSVGWVVRRAGERAGIDRSKRCSCHTLRHTFATQYVLSGGDSHSLARLLGHTSTKMAERYVNLNSKNIESIYRKHSPVSNLL